MLYTRFLAFQKKKKKMLDCQHIGRNAENKERDTLVLTSTPGTLTFLQNFFL